MAQVGPISWKIRVLSIFDPEKHLDSGEIQNFLKNFLVFRETSDFFVGETVEEDQNVVPNKDFTTPTRNDGGG